MGPDDNMTAEEFWSDPRHFMNQYPEHVRPERYLSPDEAFLSVKTACTELFDVYDTLRGIVIAYESTIRKRWLKKTRVKRKALLEEAYPGIPKSHAPEVKALKAGVRETSSTNKEVFLIPFVNLEDLCSESGAIFLSLLHYRAHYFPSEFAQFDKETIRFAIVFHTIKRVYAHDCTVISYGDRTTYGKVVRWGHQCEDGMSAQQLEFRGDAFGVGDALVVFETQKKLLMFLLRSVEKLLWDINCNSIPSQLFLDNILPPPDIPVPQDMDYGWESIARQEYLRAYRCPLGFSLEAFSSVVESHYELAVDHLIDLRTDPRYLADQLEIYVAHRPESMSTPRAPQTLIHDRAATFLLSDAFGDFAYWHLLRVAVEKTRRASSDDSVVRGRRLPKSYEDGLQDIDAILKLMEQKTKARYPQILTASPRFRQYFSVGFLDTQLFRTNIIKSKVIRPGDKLFIILARLLDEDEVHAWKITKLYDELDNVLGTSQAERARISPQLSYILTQLGTVYDLIGMMERHRPRVDPESSEATAGRLKRIGLRLFDEIDAHDGQHCSMRNAAFPVSKFHYPSGPKTEEWARKCEAVDDTMSTFWEIADHEMLIQVGRPLFDLVLGVVHPHLTPREDWIKLVRPKTTRKPPPGQYIPVLEISCAPLPDAGPQKAKVKRRGEPHSVDEELLSATIAEPTSEPATIEPITVSSRTSKTLQMIFRFASNEEVHRQQGEVAWVEILHAFSELGFEIIKTRGSSWRFSRSGDGGCFTVHAPHAKPFLSFWKTRGLGTRLTRRLGWTAAHFVKS